MIIYKIVYENNFNRISIKQNTIIIRKKKHRISVNMKQTGQVWTVFIIFKY